MVTALRRVLFVSLGVMAMMATAILATWLAFLMANTPISDAAAVVALNSALLSFAIALWIGFGIGRRPRLLGGKR